MKKKWFFAALTVVSVVVLSLAACGQTDESNDSIADLKGDVARLQSEKISDESYISSLEADSAAKDARIAELESEIAAAINESESSVEESSDDDFGYDDAVYYDTLEELVAEYRSGEWDGDDWRYYRKNGNGTTIGHSDGEIKIHVQVALEDYIDVCSQCSTGIYPDLPDEKTPRDYIDTYYHDEANDNSFECIMLDGVHAYSKGQETNFYPLDDVAIDSEFTFFGRTKCVRSGGKFIDYQATGGPVILLENVVGEYALTDDYRQYFALYDGQTIEIIVRDSREDEYETYTIANDATSIYCSLSNTVLYTSVDGLTYLICLDDWNDVWPAIENRNLDAIPRHCLGQESPEYYIAEYRRFAIAFEEEKESMSHEERALARPLTRLLNTYSDVSE